MSDTTAVPGEYEISSDPARLDPVRIHHWLSTDAYWALGRSREQQDRAIAGSLNFGVYDRASGELVAYARAVTDHATFAYLCDVYVDRSVRGKGLGTALAAAVRDRLAPLGLRRRGGAPAPAPRGGGRGPGAPAPSVFRPCVPSGCYGLIRTLSAVRSSIAL
ncbi:GNAT family N-acetyltransferase [[Kitasatospora] papulosa]|uniref:GNAT family N-acetyltransferase n=1 Tax=[Kitasatospora] papulosa TaxID=1464011 RepID=UPI0036BB8AE8